MVVVGPVLGRVEPLLERLAERRLLRVTDPGEFVGFRDDGRRTVGDSDVL